MSKFRFLNIVIAITGLLTLISLGGCMGSPGAGGSGSGGGGFTGNPPPGPTPKTNVGNPSFMVSSGGAITSSVHLMMRASFGEPPGGPALGNTTVATSANLQMRASMQSSVADTPGL